MSQIAKLSLGELKRLITYKILPISVATSFIWMVIFFFISKEDALHIAPLLIFVDVTVMTILLIGAAVHLEKQEGTIKSMMVMPVSLAQILISKALSSIVLGFISVIITSLALFFIHGIVLNYGLLFIFIIISGLSHVAIGFMLALYSKDFTSMLVLLMAYMFPFAVPTVLFLFGIIKEKYEWLLLISPSHSASTLITSSVTREYDWIMNSIAFVYLVGITIVLFKQIVYPKFKNNAVRG